MKRFFCLFLMISAISLPSYAEEKKEPTRSRIKYKKVDPMTRNAEGFAVTDGYVHTWAPFPIAEGKSISGGINKTGAVKGYVTVMFFIASWNVKSQELITKFMKIEKKYRNLNTDFIYVFTHDTYQDAEAFTKEYKVRKALLAGHEINKAFHHPKVPTVYISDRKGWLVKRYLDVSLEDIVGLDKFIRQITAI